MLATRNDILKYIPQRYPFVMVHELVEASTGHAVTHFEILTDNQLVKDGFLTEAGMIENIAQTAAAQAGYICEQQHREVPIGFIASVKDLRVFDRAPVGAVITTAVQIFNQVMNITLARGVVSVEGKNICECEIRIFVKEEV